MEIRSAFTVPATPDDAFRFLLDLERVGPCIPGGEIGPAAEDGSYPARITVKLGPMRVVYEGTTRIAEHDEADRRAVLLAEAREARGQGGARASMTMAVRPGGAGADVDVVTDLVLTGRPAQMGRGVIEDVARKLVGEMTECLGRRMSAADSRDAAPEPAGAERRELSGARVLFSVLLARLKKIVTPRR